MVKRSRQQCRLSYPQVANCWWVIVISSKRKQESQWTLFLLHILRIEYTWIIFILIACSFIPFLQLGCFRIAYVQNHKWHRPRAPRFWFVIMHTCIDAIENSMTHVTIIVACTGIYGIGLLVLRVCRKRLEVWFIDWLLSHFLTYQILESVFLPVPKKKSVEMTTTCDYLSV